MNSERLLEIIEEVTRLDSHAAQLRGELLKCKDSPALRRAEEALAKAAFPLQEARYFLKQYRDSQ